MLIIISISNVYINIKLATTTASNSVKVTFIGFVTHNMKGHRVACGELANIITLYFLCYNNMRNLYGHLWLSIPALAVISIWDKVNVYRLIIARNYD